MRESLTVIILTFNEEKHLARCITSLQGLADRICVIDSGSTDTTCEIAVSYGAEVWSNKWVNHAAQFNWALDNVDVQTDWIMRIDADELIEALLLKNLKEFLKNPSPKLNAAMFRRKVIFLNREIKHGFSYPLMTLRLWRSGKGRIEQRWMDEHVIVNEEKSVTLDGDLTDHNLNNLSWWLAKHDGYALREAYDLVILQHTKGKRVNLGLDYHSALRRLVKESVYVRLPSGIRSTLYFIYRYVLGFGFLDGKAGFFFHFFQAYWYRTLVDAKLLELAQEASERNLSIYQLLKERGVF